MGNPLIATKNPGESIGEKAPLAIFVGQITTWGCGPHLVNGFKKNREKYIYIERESTSPYIWDCKYIIFNI